MKQITSLIAVFGLAVVGLWAGWQWFFCRFYVEPNTMAVIIAKDGKDLPPGQILAKKGQKGIQEEVLGEGRHFLNPILFECKFYPVIQIPAGKVGTVTSKVGNDLPPGEFLAKPGQKGVWKQVLGPGKYRMNPIGYFVEIIDAVNIPIGYVGVVTSLSGEKALEGELAKANEKGIRADILQPGLYYINPKAYKVDLLEIGINQVSLLGKIGSTVIAKSQIATQNKALEELQSRALADQVERRQEYFAAEAPPAQAQSADGARQKSRGLVGRLSSAVAGKAGGKYDRSSPQSPSPSYSPSVSTIVLDQFVEFPSRDGFEISLDMTVELELLPERIAWIYRSYGDLPALVDKIIMPQILSISRLKGSTYRAVDFIVGEGRERFQNDLTDSLAKTLSDRKIVVHNALIRHVNVPMQILDPIQQASIAVEQDLTNKEKQNTAKKQGLLNTGLSLIEQRREQVAQETEKMKAEIKAEQEKMVAEIRAGTIKKSAEIEKQTADVRAEKTTKLGKAGADVIKMVEGEKAAGFQMKIKAVGDPQAYNLMEFSRTLNDKLEVNILHAGPGTLWTDLDKARLGDLGGAAVIEKAK
jgi:regulator of protease activity HflC (stomatin/prohibitin superfamily)